MIKWLSKSPEKSAGNEPEILVNQPSTKTIRVIGEAFDELSRDKIAEAVAVLNDSPESADSETSQNVVDVITQSLTNKNKSYILGRTATAVIESIRLIKDSRIREAVLGNAEVQKSLITASLKDIFSFDFNLEDRASELRKMISGLGIHVATSETSLSAFRELAIDSFRKGSPKTVLKLAESLGLEISSELAGVATEGYLAALSKYNTSAADEIFAQFTAVIEKEIAPAEREAAVIKGVRLELKKGVVGKDPRSEHLALIAFIDKQLLSRDKVPELKERELLILHRMSDNLLRESLAPTEKWNRSSVSLCTDEINEFLKTFPQHRIELQRTTRLDTRTQPEDIRDVFATGAEESDSRTIEQPIAQKVYRAILAALSHEAVGVNDLEKFQTLAVAASVPKQLFSTAEFQRRIKAAAERSLGLVSYRKQASALLGAIRTFDAHGSIFGDNRCREKALQMLSAITPEFPAQSVNSDEKNEFLSIVAEYANNFGIKLSEIGKLPAMQIACAKMFQQTLSLEGAAAADPLVKSFELSRELVTREAYNACKTLIANGDGLLDPGVQEQIDVIQTHYNLPRKHLGAQLFNQVLGQSVSTRTPANIKIIVDRFAPDIQSDEIDKRLIRRTLSQLLSLDEGLPSPDPSFKTVSDWFASTMQVRPETIHAAEVEAAIKSLRTKGIQEFTHATKEVMQRFNLNERFLKIPELQRRASEIVGSALRLATTNSAYLERISDIIHLFKLDVVIAEMPGVRERIIDNIPSMIASANPGVALKVARMIAMTEQEMQVVIQKNPNVIFSGLRNILLTASEGRFAEAVSIALSITQIDPSLIKSQEGRIGDKALQSFLALALADDSSLLTQCQLLWTKVGRQPGDFLPNIKTACLEAYTRNYFSTENAEKILNTLGVNHVELTGPAINGMLNMLADGNSEDAASFEKYAGKVSDIVKTPEGLRAALEGAKSILRGVTIRAYFTFVEKFNLTSEIKSQNKDGSLITAALAAIKSSAKSLDEEPYILKLQKLFELNDVAVRSSVKDGLIQACLKSSKVPFEALMTIAEKFKVTKAEIYDAILTSGDRDYSLPLDTTELARFFSDPKNQNLYQYVIALAITKCSDYFFEQATIIQAKTDATPEEKRKGLLMFAILFNDFKITNSTTKDLDSTYLKVKEGLWQLIDAANPRELKSIAIAFAGQALENDPELLMALVSHITARSKTKTSEKLAEGEVRGTLGLSAAQEVSLRALLELDQSTTNDYLFRLAQNETLDRRLRLAIIRTILQKHTRGIPDALKAIVLSADTLGNEKDPALLVEELKFLLGVNGISSKSLRDKALPALNTFYAQAQENGILPSVLRETYGPHIPDEVFASAWTLGSGKPAQIHKTIDGLYAQVKGSQERSSLLYAVTTLQSLTNEPIRIAAIDKLSTAENVQSSDFELITKYLEILIIIGDTYARNDNNFDVEVARLIAKDHYGKIVSILSGKQSISETVAALETATLSAAKDLLPHSGVTEEKLRLLLKEWGTILPIFLYASKMSNSEYKETQNYLAEMVANFDPPTYQKWAAWRYNPENTVTAKQLTVLSPKQLATWKTSDAMLYDEVMMKEVGADKPIRVAERIQESVLHGHLASSEDSDPRDVKLQNQLRETFTATAANPENRSKIIDDELTRVGEELGAVTALIRFNDIKKLEDAARMLAANPLPVNKKVRDTLDFLATYLPSETLDSVGELLTNAPKEGVVLPPELQNQMLTMLRTVTTETKKAAEVALQSKIAEKMAITAQTLAKNIGVLHNERKELTTIRTLYRLSQLTPEHIARNRILVKPTKRGESITSALRELKQRFAKNASFLQDIETITGILETKNQLSEKYRIGVLLSDDPRMMIQLGKYPEGNGSCQNYEGSADHNQALAGYMGDAHSKVIYLYNVNRFPPEAQARIDDEGIDAVIASLSNADFMESIIGRSIVKLVATPDKKPMLFIEPTYTTLQKTDQTLKQYVLRAVRAAFATPMGIQIAEGSAGEAGDVTVTVPASRNPGGQYEDGAFGAANNPGIGRKTVEYTMPAKFVSEITESATIGKVVGI